MKVLKIVLASFVVVFGLLYVTLFTSVGHGILLPIVEGKVKQSSGIKNFYFDTFSLSPSHLDTTIKVEDQEIKVVADFSIFSSYLDLSYSVDIKDLSKFNYLSTQKVRGTFFTKGTVKGKFENLKIDGDGEVANGALKYDLSLVEYNPKDIHFETNGVKIDKLLYMVHQPEYLLGSFNSSSDISSKELEKVIVDAKVVGGSVNDTLVKELFKITLPNSDFTLNTKASINNGLGDFDVDMNSSLISLMTKGKIDTKTLNLDSKYDVKIKTLALLEQINGVKLNGSFNTNGTVKGDKKLMIIDGFTDIAKSDTKYHVELKEFQPANIQVDLVKAKLAELLYTANQPIYTKGGDLTSIVKLDSIQPLKGKITTTIENGLLDPKVVKKEFDMDLPNKADFDLKVNTNLEKNDIISDVLFNSFAAKLTTVKTHYDLEKAKLQTDYTLMVPSLGDLYFITKQKMQGDITVTGDVTFDKTFLVTFASKKFGGSIDGKLDDTKLSVKAKDIATLKLLHMMYYPEIFTSKLQLDLDYDTKTKQGLANFDMGNGKFENTETLQMISKILNKDISLEIYKIATIKSKIDDTKLDNELYFQSDNVSLTSKKFFVDTEKQTLDSSFDLAYQKLTIGVDASGSLSDPKMKVNFNKAVQQKAKERASKLIEKKLGDKMDENVKGILNNLFK